MQKRLILVTIKSHSITIKPPSNHNKSHYFWFLAVLIIHSKKNIKSSLNIRKSSLKSSLIHEITIRSPWTHQEISIKHTKPPVFSNETTISSSRGCHRAASHPSGSCAWAPSGPRPAAQRAVPGRGSRCRCSPRPTWAATTTTGDHGNGEEKHGDLEKSGFSWEKSEVETLLGGYGDFFYGDLGVMVDM